MSFDRRLHRTARKPAERRRNRIVGQWAPRLVELLESPAWRVMSLSAHRVVDRIDIELRHHGGTENGKLIVTFDQF
jgi:CRISPR/Cas system Type II protein with McrA/HNH and RuvC-like nuclease domain